MFILVLLFVSQLAVADDIDQLLSMSMGEMMNMKVETASRHLESIADAPANVLVINQREIRARRYRNLIDLMVELPGFNIQRHTSSTKYHRYVWRGYLGNNKFLLLLDGVRIGDPAGAGIVIADNFDLRHIKRVEVVYGPASALYGADAAAGVINLITMDVADTVDTVLQLETGSNNAQRLGGVSGIPLANTGSLLLAAHASRDDTADLSRYYRQDFTPVNATTFGGTVITPAAQRERYVSPVQASSGFARFRTKKGLEIGAYHNRSRHLSSIGETPKGVIYNPNSFWQQDITTLYGRKKTMLSNDIESNTLLNFSRLEISPTSSFQNRFTDFRSGYQYMRNERIELDQQFSYDINEQNNATFGVSWGEYSSIPKTADTPRPVNINQAITGQNMFYPNTANGVPIQLYDIQYQHLGLFSQMTRHWNQQWTSTAGLRYDRDSRYKGSWNPRLSIIYQPSSIWAWKLMYGEAFRAPSTVETHETYGSFSGARNAAGQFTSFFFHLANPNLQPEKSRTLELVLQGTPLPSVYTTLSVFYTRINNVISAAKTTMPPLMLANAAIRTIEINQNIGREHFYGLEFYLKQEADLTHGVKGRLWTSYSYLDGRLDTGNGGVPVEIPYIAKHNLRLGVAANWQMLEVGSNMRFVGKSNSNKADPLDAAKKQKISGYSLVDLHIGADKLFNVGSLDLDISNLFDRRYHNANGGGIKFLRSQQPPRTYMASFRMDL
ncbi:MAG: TonB-dependent receptor [Mariprofundaceae bacterium]|nr:TonB-dependent receptor [Mariprofundaceae bacterium]